MLRDLCELLTLILGGHSGLCLWAEGPQGQVGWTAQAVCNRPVGSLRQTHPGAFLRTVTDVLLDGWTLTDHFPFDVASPSAASDWAHFTCLAVTVRAGWATVTSSDRPGQDMLQIARVTVSHFLGCYLGTAVKTLCRCT